METKEVYGVNNMNKWIKQEWIDRLVEYATNEEPRIIEIRLFGSRQTGWSRHGRPPLPDSDLDVAIVTEWSHRQIPSYYANKGPEMDAREDYEKSEIDISEMSHRLLGIGVKLEIKLAYSSQEIVWPNAMKGRLIYQKDKAPPHDG